MAARVTANTARKAVAAAVPKTAAALRAAPPIKQFSVIGKAKEWVDAKVAKAGAEVDAVKAAKAKADAEKEAAEEMKKKNAAEKAKADAEKEAAEQLKKKTEAEVAALNAKKKAKKWKKYAFAAGSFVLFLDWLWRSCGWVQHKRVKRRMLQGPDDSLLPPIVPEDRRLPLPDLDLEGLDQPLRLWGPSGSGKSTRLAKAAQDYQKREVPVMYIRFRGPGSGDAEEGRIDLSVMAQRVFASSGYSPSQSIIEWASDLPISIKATIGKMDFKAAQDQAQASRLNKAFATIVAVAVELHEERKDKFIDEDLSKPIIIVDEVHDLLRNAKYGKQVFDAYTTALIENVTDMQHFRSVSANSGGDSGDTGDRSSRVTDVFQEDVPEPAVRDLLLRLGYPPEDVDLIVTVCGCRLRLLRRFLRRKQDPGKVKELTNVRLNAASREIISLKLRDPKGEHVGKMRVALDKVAAGESIDVSEIPVVFREPFPKTVLYLGPKSRISFQSSAVRQAWAEERLKWVDTKPLATK